MPRKKRKKLEIKILPDEKFKSVLVSKLINKVMERGKKSVAKAIVYGAMEEAGNQLKKEPLVVLETAIKNISPQVQIRSRRVGGANYQIPIEVSPRRRLILALQWLTSAARGRKGMPMAKRLAAEIVDAYNSTGGAFKKKEETHRMAEANRAFAHLARF